MQATHVSALEGTIQKTNEWLAEIQRALGAKDREHAYRALRATLHVLRDRLAPNEALHLGAQLPTLIRGIYYEGWRLADKPVRLRTRDEFLGAISSESGDPILDAGRAARAVFEVLDAKIAGGEIDQIKAGLPEMLRDLWP